MDKDVEFTIIDPIDPAFIPETPPEDVAKHLPGGHDQATHGSWASGEELSAWDPHSPVPGSPRNAGGMTARMWDLWEHGPDGNQYVELYRQYAGEALGIAVPKSPMDVGGWNYFITKPGYGGSSIETARKDAVAIVNAIANGKPEQPALYRGMTATDDNEKALLDSITRLKPGDTLDMPLVSTTRSLGVAAWYAGDRSSSGEGNVIMKIQAGAKGVSVKPENSWYPHDHEVITSGKFEIVSVTTVEAPYWKRGTFEPRKLEFRPEYGGTSYEVATYGPKTYTVEESKVAYDAVSSGNWGSLETSTFKLTDDRRKGGTFKTLSSWEKQEPRQFTVVEVKMVGDHRVEKADSTDYGLTFDALFNKVPFIRNEEDVQKHGTHDQKTHGSWARGSVPTSIETTTNAIGQEIQKITYGDIVFERDKPGEVRDDNDQSRFMWTYRAGNDSMRIVASRIMDTENPNIRTPELSEGEIKSLVEGTVYPAGSISADGMRKGLEQTISATYTLLEDARASTPLPMPLYRGISVANGSPATTIKVGDSFTMPLSATTNQQELAERYARPREASNETPMVFTFREGVKATPIRHTSDATGSDIYSEYVTQGKFKVVSVDKSNLVMDGNTRVSGYIKVEVEHTDIFSIDKGGYEPVRA